ncbi:MAG: hypothetical protein QN144_14510 [Armatimonadota bacterium]|nr:hypothetical protein [Armatimonadota bacterium]
MAQQQAQYRTVTLTDRPPVRIREDAWPVVARADYDWHDNEVPSQAFRSIRAHFRVRQHADGRALVYAVYDYSTAYTTEQNVYIRVGRLVNPGADIPRAIRQVAAELRERLAREGQDERVADRMADEAIAELPAEET